MADSELPEAATTSALKPPSARFKLSWTRIASILGAVFTSWMIAGMFLLAISVAAYLSLESIHASDTASIMVVFVPCIIIIVLMLRGIALDSARYHTVQKFLDQAFSACSDNADFSVKMREFRTVCVANKSEETAYISARFVQAINDLEPDIYRTPSSRVVILSNYVNEREVFESYLPRLADQIVRVALLCTFAGIAYALILTAGQLEHLNSSDKSAQDSVALVRGLIHSASFKFIISAVGLSCVIILRMISASSESRIRSRISAIFTAFAEHSAIFSHARQHGGNIKPDNEPIDMPKLLEQLANQLEHNIHMREAAAYELARGFQEAASAIQIDFTGRFNEQLYERFSLVFGAIAQENRQALEEVVVALDRVAKEMADRPNSRKAPVTARGQAKSNDERPPSNVG